MSAERDLYDILEARLHDVPQLRPTFLGDVFDQTRTIPQRRHRWPLHILESRTARLTDVSARDAVPTAVPETSGLALSGGFTMSSALKLVVAGVIVALFGGFLLTGVFTTQQGDGVVPAAVTGSPSPRITYEPTDDPAVLKVISEPHKKWLEPAGPIAIDPDGGVWIQGSDGKRAFLVELGVPGRTELGRDEHSRDVWYSEELEFSGNGTLWASTSGGLISLEGDTWTKTGNGVVGIVDLTLAPDGVLYGLSWVKDVIRIADGEVTSRLWVLQSFRARALAVTPDGRVWVGGRGRGSGVLADGGSGWLRVLRLDDQTYEVVTPLGEGIDPFVADLALGPDGALWALMRTEDDSYLGRYDGETWSIHSTADGLPAVGARPMGGDGDRMAVGPDGRIWFSIFGVEGEDDGLAAFDGQEFTRYLVPAEVGDLAVAPDGSAWASTGKGIYVIRPEAVAAAE